MKVLLADDHQLVRSGLCSLLSAMPGVQVVAEVADGVEAVRLAIELKPDVALLDIAMPRLSGLAAMRQMKSQGLATKVLLLSMYDKDEYVAEAMHAGAAGYIVKDSAVDELEQALQVVMRGEVYLSPVISAKLAQAFRSGQSGPALTERQSQILGLVAQGFSSKEIARQLDLSIKTVETHRAQIMERLDIHDLAGLVRYAVRCGLVDADS